MSNDKKINVAIVGLGFGADENAERVKVPVLLTCCRKAFKGAAPAIYCMAGDQAAEA